MVGDVCTGQQVNLVRRMFFPSFPQYISIYPRLSTKLSTNLFTGNSSTIVLRSNSSGTLLVPPAAAGEEQEKKARPMSPPGSFAIALRQGDCVPLHPLLNSYPMGGFARRYT